MKIGIPVYYGFDMLDVTGPWEMFYWAKLFAEAAKDLEVYLCAETPGLILNNYGLGIDVTNSFAAAPQFDVLWVPGGAPDALAWLMYHEPGQTYLKFLQKQASGATYVCSVCEGAMLLAQAGLLDGYTVTTHWAFVPCFQQRFPKVQLADGFPRFQLDRNRLTGGGISSGLDESLELLTLLYGQGVAEIAQQNTQYYPDPPVSSAIPQTASCPVPMPSQAVKPPPAPLQCK
jgi:transcriptional regulator GlxA family with amidase domain